MSIEEDFVTALASRKEIGLEFYKSLLTHSYFKTREGAVKVLDLWPELSSKFIKQLMSDWSGPVRFFATRNLVLRNYFSETEMKNLLGDPDYFIRSGAKKAVSYKNYFATKITLDKFEKMLFAVKDSEKELVSKLMLRRKDLPLNFLLTLAKGNNLAIKMNAYLALYHRKDISKQKVINLINSGRYKDIIFGFLEKNKLK